MTIRRWGAITAIALLTAACSGASLAGGSASANHASLTIYAAASLNVALASVKTAYETAVPGTTLTISTDSSSALEAKIEQAAPADVFLSADTTNPQKLMDKGLASGAVVTFAGNRLAVIVPRTNPAGIRTPADLANPGVKVIAAGESVPITKYATRLIANLAAQAGYPADFAAKYAANIASREDSVAGVVSKVGLGEGDVGIVYVTDARASSDVTMISVPDAASVHAAYAGVVVRASLNQAAARAFLAWLAGADGKSILASFGFLPPS